MKTTRPIRRFAAAQRAGMLALAVLTVCQCSSENTDRIDRLEIPAPSLATSVLRNPATVPALVLLPAGWDSRQRRLRVVYYLPGFTTDVTEYVDGTFDGFNFQRTLRKLEGNRTIDDLVVVIVHGRNQLGGSFYVNSPVTGRWEDCVVYDVVPFIEAHYRVARDRAGRGIAGESMGGFGALHLAMRHPEIFGTVFALSPGLFDEQGLEDFGFLSSPYVEAWLRKSETMRRWSRLDAPRRFTDFVGEVMAADGRFNNRRAFGYAYGAAFAPAPLAGPPFVDFPFVHGIHGIEADPGRLERFRAGFGHLEEKVQAYGPGLRTLRGIGIDVGRNDPLAWIPRGARRLASLLDAAGIPCRLTEHDGGHVDRLGERIETQMVPFFTRTLVIEASPGVAR